MERIVDKNTQGLARKWKDAVPKIYQLAGDSACSHHLDIKHLLEMHKNVTWSDKTGLIAHCKV